MRRQLYRGGGITRQRYGLGDLVRKLIPNEIADVAVKAAPFVAPFNPGVAGLMRGLGRLDQRGNLTDALNESRAITRKAMSELEFDALGLDSTFQMTIRGLKLKQKIET